ncbi:hypothetical protein [Halorhodospira sp. 9622]|uniref:head-tail joining protein n=1 Tax=Halorhodospira sp. 9622 TaxID=2899136 RepID=UPI001EE84070|nr:hypothetical protein [Halorhodospira sp. 9622]MCG5538949.1 hypothetical protein [Halorhodospira sp. 9622]
MEAMLNEAVLATWGRSVEYRPREGEPCTVRGVFEAAYAEPSGYGVSVASAAPRLLTALAELPSKPGRHDEVVVDGTTYAVAHPEPDGHGWVTLHLEVIDE